MIVYIEGIDCTGKSTLAKEITRESDVVKHIDGKHPNTYKSFKEMFKKYGSNLILDRGPIGELVYGPKFRQESRITFKEVARLLNDFNILVDLRLIYDFDNVYNQMKTREEETGIKSDLKKDLIQDQVKWMEVLKELYPLLNIAAKKRFYVNVVDFKNGEISLTEVDM